MIRSILALLTPRYYGQNYKEMYENNLTITIIKKLRTLYMVPNYFSLPISRHYRLLGRMAGFQCDDIKNKNRQEVKKLGYNDWYMNNLATI